MTLRILILVVTVGITGGAVAQEDRVPAPPDAPTPPSGVHTSPPKAPRPVAWAISPTAPGPFELPPHHENNDDPGYVLYKEAYNLILEEKWEEARKKFQELVSKYPKSEYLDDAEYWSAYALKHINRTKATAEYEKFVEKYPHSNYFDDALADMTDLNMNVVVTSSGNSSPVVKAKPHGFSHGIAPEVKLSEEQLRKAEEQVRRSEQQLRRQMRRQTFSIDLMRPSPRPLAPGVDEEPVDPETRVKMDALYAIGEMRDDEKSFHALKDVALDVTQSHYLRRAALDVLTDFKKFDVAQVLLELAKNDTSEQMQNAAIEYLGQTSKDKNRSVETLVVLFQSIPKHRKGQLETVLYAVAEIGNDKAIDFLSRVARTHEDYELRSDAVYYLGHIGSDKARTVLHQILRGK